MPNYRNRDRPRIRLIVVDSIASLFRGDTSEYGTSMSTRAAALFSIAQELKRLASKYNLAVVCINQVHLTIVRSLIVA